MKKNVLSISGGKDSTAMLMMMIKKGYTIDEAVFIDTGMEFSSMYSHLDQLEKDANLPITRLPLEKSFLYYMLHHKKRNGDVGYKWCGRMCRWATTLKKQVFAKYIKNKYHNNIIEYQGIAADEVERLHKNKDKKWEVKYPLAELDITEAEALQLCYQKGYVWNGLYNNFDRVSCWCCWNKNLKELRAMYYFYNDIWVDLKALERQIGIPFKDNYNLTQLEHRFRREGIQMKLDFS